MSKMCYFHSAILTEVLHHRHQRHYEKRAEQQNCNIFSALSTMAWHGILSHSALLPVFLEIVKATNQRKDEIKKRGESSRATEANLLPRSARARASEQIL